jgi:hypothetical protein
VAEGAQRVFKNAHLEIEAAAPHGRIRAIGFNLAANGEALTAGVYGLVHTPTLDRWRDRERLELRLTHVAPLPPGDDVSGPEIVDLRRDAGGARLVLDPRADAIYGFPSHRPEEEECEFVAYADFARGDRRWRRLWLAAPPFDPYRLASFLAAADEVVFGFGADAVPEAREFLAGYYPSREKLAALYRAWRDEGAATTEDDAGRRRALAIFAELGLADGEGGAITERPEGEGGAGDAGRRRLEDSPVFRRCERRRREAGEFVAGLCRWPTAVLRALAADLLVAARGVDTDAEVF